MRAMISEKAPIESFLYDEDYLAHHGIKGQKWGLRRYQNEDGTLTEAGKERYLNKIEKESRKIISEQEKGDRYKKKYMKTSRKMKKANTKNNVLWLFDPKNKSMVSKIMERRLSHLVKKDAKYSKLESRCDKAVKKLSKTLYKDIMKISENNKEISIAAIDSAMEILGDKYVKDLFDQKKHTVERGSGIIHSDFVITDELLFNAESLLK